jgi:hypothetical protein
MADPIVKPAALQVVIPLSPIDHIDLAAAASAAGASMADHARDLLLRALREPEAPDLGPALDQAEAHLLGLSEAVGGLRGLAQRRAQGMAANTAAAAANGGLPAIPQDQPCPVTSCAGPNGASAPGGQATGKAGATVSPPPSKPHVSGRPVPASRADVRARYRF